MTDEDSPDTAVVNPADHHKHMDYVQAVITRLATNSFLLKGWSLTLGSALLGFAIGRQQWGLALTAALPILAFWLLDTYYLRQERAFRAMYDDVAAKRLTNFTIKPAKYAEKISWKRTGLSITLLLFYAPLLALTLIVTAVLLAVGKTAPPVAPSVFPATPATSSSERRLPPTDLPRPPVAPTPGS